MMYSNNFTIYFEVNALLHIDTNMGTKLCHCTLTGLQVCVPLGRQAMCYASYTSSHFLESYVYLNLLIWPINSLLLSGTFLVSYRPVLIRQSNVGRSLPLRYVAHVMRAIDQNLGLCLHTTGLWMGSSWWISCASRDNLFSQTHIFCSFFHQPSAWKWI